MKTNSRFKLAISILSLTVVLGVFGKFLYSDSESNCVLKIKNFGKINDNYYRGGQPKKEEFANLKDWGVRTVIDLQKDGLDREIVWAQNAGLKYFNIPLSSTRPATALQTEYFLKLVNDPANWPVYVHCAAGRHRTGAMTAIYRITHDSWTADLAYKEMKKYGYYSFPNHGSLKKFVYKYFENFLNSGMKINYPIQLRD